MVRERAGRRVTLLRAFIKAESRERTIRGNLSWRGSSTRGAYDRGKQYCLLGNNYSREEGRMQEVSSFVTELVSRALLKICYSVGIVMPGGADMTVRTFTAILRQEGNLYVAECPEVGTASQGQTVEEAI